MEFRVRPRFLLACFAVLCSWLLPLTVGDDVDTSFVVGESVTLNCEIKDLDTEGSFVSWAKGSTTLFEDESIVPGAEDPTRYKLLNDRLKMFYNDVFYKHSLAQKAND